MRKFMFYTALVALALVGVLGLTQATPTAVAASTAALPLDQSPDLCKYLTAHRISYTVRGIYEESL